MKDSKAWRAALRGALKRLWHALSGSLGLKLLSVLFALFLWSYVISANSSFTREKVLTGIDVSVSGQSVLASREFALLTDPTDVEDVRVTVRAPQSSYGQVSADNVRVELDLSGVRATGRQSVRLRATSLYGTVVQISPEYVALDVESLAQRYVPVNVELAGKDDATYWYDWRVNPSQITVTGPTSVVRTVSSAQVRVDVGELTGRTESHSRVEEFSLVDSKGIEVPGTLSRSTSTVTLSLDIYPVRTLDVASDVKELITGQVPDGYQIESIEVSPEQIVVAAEQTMLDSLTALIIEPVDVTGANQTFSTIARIQSLKGIRKLSSEEVSVTVNIVEQALTKRFSNVQLQLVGAPEDKEVASSAMRVDVKIEGPYSIVRMLTRGDIQASVNLNGLSDGQYELPVELSVDNYPDLLREATPVTVRVTLSPREAGAQ